LEEAASLLIKAIVTFFDNSSDDRQLKQGLNWLEKLKAEKKVKNILFLDSGTKAMFENYLTFFLEKAKADQISLSIDLLDQQQQSARLREITTRFKVYPEELYLQKTLEDSHACRRMEDLVCQMVPGQTNHFQFEYDLETCAKSRDHALLKLGMVEMFFY
jgi:hypothetical protein